MITNELSIGEVSRRTGLRPSALRYYESLGLLDAPRRVGKHRRYQPAVLQRLAVIQLAQQAGFTMAEIAVLLHGFAPDTPPAVRWQALARRKLAEVEATISRAQEMRRLLLASLRCGCLAIEECPSLLHAGQPADAAPARVGRIDALTLGGKQPAEPANMVPLPAGDCQSPEAAPVV